MDAQDREPDLKAFLALLRRQWRLILLTTAAVVAVALLWLLTLTPVYQATALVLVDPAQKNLLQPADTSPASAASESARVDSEVEILRSDATLLAVIAGERLVEDPGFTPPPRLRDRLTAALGMGGGVSDPEIAARAHLSHLREAVVVRRRGLTYLITVTAYSPDPVQAARLANAVVDTYVSLQVAGKVEYALSARDLLQARLDAARSALAAAEQALDRFISENLGSGVTSGGTAITDLRSELERQTGALLALDLRARRAAEALAAEDWDTVAARLADPGVDVLVSRRDDLLDATEQAALVSQPELAQVEAELKLRAGVALTQLQGEVAQMEASAAALRQRVHEEMMGDNIRPSAMAAVYELQQEAGIARRQYQAHLQRLRDLEAEATVQIADSRLVSPAMAPLFAAFPNKRQIMVLALFLGVGLGIALAYLKEYYVGGVTSIRQLRNILHLPVAGAVPLVPGQGGAVADTTVNARLSPFAEAIRRVRASLDQTLPGGREGGQVILLTSSIPKEGKSTLAVALARTYALAGKRVLLLDSDLRHPSIHQILGLVPEIGFLDYLRDPVEGASTFCVRDPLGGAEVVLGAAPAEEPTDQLLISDAFQHLIQEARETFDIVILDSPPVLPVVDARYVAPHADAVLLTVRAGYSNQSDIRQAVSQLQEVMAPSARLSVVLNHATEGQRIYQGYSRDYAITPSGAWGAVKAFAMRRPH